MNFELFINTLPVAAYIKKHKPDSSQNNRGKLMNLFALETFK